MDDGQGCWALKSSKLNFKQEVFLIGRDRDLPETKFKHILGVHFKCYYFIYEASLLPSQTLTFIREIAKEKGGIRVYRNGFRVLPYGEKLNDWLGLDESVAKRVILSAHRNINFFGFVELTDASGLLFDETSSREGLLENDAYHELVDFVQRSIISAITKIAELRERKGATSQKNWVKKDKTSTEKVDDAITKIKEVFDESGENQNESNSADSNRSKEKFNEAYSELLEGRDEEKREKETLINEVNMLRVLAGLGLVIGEFVHEVKRFLPAFDADIVFIKDVVKEFSEALIRAERLDTNLKSFTAYTAYFDKAISQNVLRELKPIDLRDVVNDFEFVIQNDINRSKITFHKPVFEAFDLYTTPMHPSEWASILFNFYTNSKKAIRRKQSQGAIFIKCGEEGEKVFLEFSDNGDGIPKENEELIFNAFFTTSSAAGHLASESDSLTGTGLGLKIVKDIVESYGGSVYVSTPEPNFNTTLRIEIPSTNNQGNGEI
jgi:signal transduction histidine kinase